MCNPESQMEPNGVSAVGYFLKCLLKLALIVAWLGSYGLLGWFAWQAGRKDYHRDMLKELEIKQGAPVLIYGPEELWQKMEGK